MDTKVTHTSKPQLIENAHCDESSRLKSIINEAFDQYNAKQSRAELRTVAHILSDLEPKTVVEIGTAQGGSLFVWSQYLDSVDQIVSIDKGHTKKSIQMCQSMSDDVNIQCLACKSQNPVAVDETSRLVQPEGIDFLYIDGGSLECEVLSDYNNFSDMVNPGGVIAFHDILTHRERPEDVEVYDVWKKVRKDATEFVEITETIDSTEYGYGLMYV